MPLWRLPRMCAWGARGTLAQCALRARHAYAPLHPLLDLNMSSVHTVRVWDLPTRLFHWALAACVVALVVTAKIGGNAMEWHLRLGYAVLALLAFRLAWGLVGGHWSRFTSLACSPRRVWAYVRGVPQAPSEVGHSPLGALAVLALLGVLSAQVGTGLISDDEIAFAGALTRFVSGSAVAQATSYHTGLGQYLVMGLVALHLLAVGFYAVVRRQKLVGAMWHGDKLLAAPATPSRDDTLARLAALALLTACAALAWWVASLGFAGGF